MAETNQKAFKKGDAVQVVLADGKLAPAQIVNIGKDLKAEVEFEHRGETVRITSSPFDPEGKKPDCWCAIPAACGRGDQEEK